jgi:hypothetical protein
MGSSERVDDWVFAQLAHCAVHSPPSWPVMTLSLPGVAGRNTNDQRSQCRLVIVLVKHRVGNRVAPISQSGPRLRQRNVRRDESLEVHLPDPVISPVGELGPEGEALLVDSAGLALQVVLDARAPAQRLAFVLNDMFEMPFDEIAPMVGQSRLRPGSYRAGHGGGSRRRQPDAW